MSASKTKTVVVLDAMGGDFSPRNEVLGALQAIEETGGRFKVVFVGRPEEIKKAISQSGKTVDEACYEIVEATEVITMDDEPVAALRQKRNSSIVKGFDLVKQGVAALESRSSGNRQCR